MSHILRIHSKHKSQPAQTNSNFTINTTPIHVVTARLKQILIPNIFNNIRFEPFSDRNSTFQYQTNGATNFFNIVDGFYTLTQLINSIEALLSGINITLTFSETTGKITLTNAGVVDFTVIGSDNNIINNTMADVLGIGASDVIVAAATSTIFPNKPNLYNYTNVYIASSRISNGFNMIDPNGRHPVLASVPINVPYGGIVTYEPTEQHDIEFVIDTNIEDIDISLVNHNGEIIPMDSNHHIHVLIETDNRPVK